jgi:ribosome maturation factor RimP
MTMEQPQALTEVSAAIEPVVAALGLDLYDVELAGPSGGRILRVSIDRADGGVDLDAITAATQALGPVLDADEAVSGAISGAYTLEVSSPGLERPLRTPAHFQRALGSMISVKTADATGADVARCRGTLLAVDGDGFELEVDGAKRRIAYDQVVGARTVFVWEPTPARSLRASTRSGKRAVEKVSS